jgi:hypothetical protein
VTLTTDFLKSIGCDIHEDFACDKRGRQIAIITGNVATCVDNYYGYKPLVRVKAVSQPLDTIPKQCHITSN